MNVKNMTNQIFMGNGNIDLLDGKHITDTYKSLMSSMGLDWIFS